MPFALAILSGVTKGFGLYMDMTQDSGIADSIMDRENLRSFRDSYCHLHFSRLCKLLLHPCCVVLGVAILLLGKIFWLVYNAGVVVPESWVFNCEDDGMCTRCNKNEGGHVARPKKAQGKEKGKVMDAIEGDANKKDEEKYCAIITPFQKHGPMLTNVLASGLLVAGFVSRPATLHVLHGLAFAQRSWDGSSRVITSPCTDKGLMLRATCGSDLRISGKSTCTSAICTKMSFCFTILRLTIDRLTEKHRQTDRQKTDKICHCDLTPPLARRSLSHVELLTSPGKDPDYPF